MEQEQKTLMVIGAHPDDCEIQTGGFALRFKKAGNRVIYMSATNGETGHHELTREQTAATRKKEFEASCDLAGFECVVTDIPSNGIMPSIENREIFIRLIRRYAPDLLLTHRPCDYHPDHRITSQLVQDCSYAIKVPKVCPDVPPLRQTPVIMYMCDNFTRPYPFSPSIALSIDDVADQKLRMIAAHKSQLFEWLPWVDGTLEQVPSGEHERFEWLKQRRQSANARIADRFRDLLCRRYGLDKGKKIKFAEAFELCEYGRRIDEHTLYEWFPL